ncbi:RE1 [Symbiodinium natans]|uniref:RE1 protein n=1 Tax=Symbiodinium natans TaxID=878477 RepID=A0A812NEX7_9DINO|nr:RE1 [Symbiodinium natans]
MALQDRESRGDGFDHLIPVWDNDPSTLRKFRRNTELWLAGLDLERTTGYSLAARFLLRQHGPARARGEEFAIEDLAYDPGESREGVDGEQHWVREPDYKKGVRKLLDAFEELSGKTRSEKKHELRSKLYGGLKRKPGESVTQFAASYRTLQGELRTEGIVVQDTEYAWIFQQRLGLSEIQRQLLETTVGEEPSYNAVEKEALRLFRRIHLKGMDDAPVRSLRTSSFSSGSTSTTPSTRRKPFHGSLRSRATPPRSEAQVAELSAPEPEEDEAQLEETQVYEGQVEESTLDLDEAQEKELEALATSLDEMEGELDDQGLNEAEAALSDMAEALMTLKEARGKIAAVKKDRGYGKPVDGGVRSSSSTSVAARKRDTKCNACGLKGHWAGDPECKSKAKPKKKVGHKNVNFAEAGDMNEAQVIDFLQGGQLDTDGFHEILAVDLADVLDVKKVETSWQKPYFAAVDSCCNRTCAGESWVEAIRKALPREFKGLWKESPESERFRFGDGGCLTSSRRVRVPMNFEGQVVLVWFSVLPNNRLAGLLGKDFLDAMGGILDFPRQTITLETLGLVNHPLQTIRAGHFAVEVNPAACVWKPVSQTSWLKVTFLKMLAPEFVQRANLAIGRWQRLVVRLQRRVSWHFWGLLLSLIRAPYLRFLPFPVPSVDSVSKWEEQAAEMVARGAYPRRYLTKCKMSKSFTASNLKALVDLRNKVGFELAFLEDEVLTVGMRALKRKPGVRARLAEAQMAEAAKASVSEDRGERVRQLLGPRGGLPRLRGELIQLAALLHVEIKAEDSVAEIAKKVRPTALMMAGKSAPASASGSPTAAPSQEDKAIPPSGPGRLAARVSPGSGRMGILYGAVKAGVRQMIGQAAGKALKMLKVAAPPLVYEALETVVENEYDKGLSEPRCPGGRPYIFVFEESPTLWRNLLRRKFDKLGGVLLTKNGFILTNIGKLVEHKEQLEKLTGDLLFQRLVAMLEDVLDETFVREAHAAEVGEPEVENEEDEDGDFEEELGGSEPSKELKRLVMKMHQNTGHCSRRRLARALTISGAPVEAVKAALQLECEVCKENARPRTRPPASLPRVSQPFDRVHADLVAIKDRAGQKFWVTHFVDIATRHQSCYITEKTASDVVGALNEFCKSYGAPKTLVTDLGPEFTAQTFSEACEFLDIYHSTTPVETPWRNGIVERAGGTFKTMAKHLVTEFSAVGYADMELVVTASTEAYNSDINDSGFSPSQSLFGRAPRKLGDVLGLRGRLAQHGLISRDFSFERQVAMREDGFPTLHEELEPGEIAYFWRKQKVAKGKVLTERWHGPSLVLTCEKNQGIPVSYYVTFKGSVTKVGAEHIRRASSLERLSATDWEDALREISQATGAPYASEGQESPSEEVEAEDELRERPRPAPGEAVMVMPVPVPAQSYGDRAGEDAKLDTVPEVPETQAAPEGAPTQESQASALGAQLSAPSGSSFVPLRLGDRTINVLTAATESQHPLKQLACDVAEDMKNGNWFEAPNGSWAGHWPTPSEDVRAVLERRGHLMNLDATEFEVFLANVGKELNWSKMSEEERQLYQAAALEQWEKWVENCALEPLTMEQSNTIRAEIKAGAKHNLLTPRFVLTDKNAPLRTPGSDLPVKANARLVVPGFRDRALLEGQLRTDAPTASRLALHLLLTISASKPNWPMMSGDVRAAFLKGDPYVTRLLFMDQPNRKRGPTLPVRPGILFKVRKGVFGLADAPRAWYERLLRTLRARGWTPSSIDGGLFFKWSPEGVLEGVMLTHVDDILVTGNSEAVKSFHEIGAELGFGSISKDKFTFCGKNLEKHANGEVTVNMVEYHRNLHIPVVPREARKDLSRALNPKELRELRALNGSLQWLVAQLRFDVAFRLCEVQVAKPTVATLLKACNLARDLKGDSDFVLTFRNTNWQEGGLVAVSDAALGNVNSDGSGEDPKTFSQSCYAVLIGGPKLVEGKRDSFNLLDFRSHKLQRVCRSSYGAETLGVEEALDAAELVRCLVAEARGTDILKPGGQFAVCTVPLTVVTDAKDTYDRVSKDTGFGAQKSLVLTLALLRQLLRRPRTCIRWTDTANMFVDAGTKAMDCGHLKRVICNGSWSIEYNTEFVRQKVKSRKASTPPPVPEDEELPGEGLTDANRELRQFLENFGSKPGWHLVGPLSSLAAGAKEAGAD